MMKYFSAQKIQSSSKVKTFYGIWRCLIDVFTHSNAIVRLLEFGSGENATATHNSDLFLFIQERLFLEFEESKYLQEMLEKDKFNALLHEFSIRSKDVQLYFEAFWLNLEQFMKQLRQAKQLSKTAFDQQSQAHEEELMRLWKALRSDTELSARISDEWKTIGFQGKNPVTDFRGMGMLGLRQLVYFSESSSGKSTFNRLTATGTTWFPFAIAGINITDNIMLLSPLKLFRIYVAHTEFDQYKIQKSHNFLDVFYSHIFCKFADQWLSSNYSVVDFNSVLKGVLNKAT